MLRITPDISINEEELTFVFSRAAGPGGQNVNRVESAVQLRFDAAGSPSLPAAVKQRLPHLAGKRLTRNGELVINAREYRSQRLNREAAVARLCELLRRAAQRPKHRRPTRPTRSSIEKRVRAKKQRSRMKTMRRKPSRDD